MSAGDLRISRECQRCWLMMAGPGFVRLTTARPAITIKARNRGRSPQNLGQLSRITWRESVAHQLSLDKF